LFINNQAALLLGKVGVAAFVPFFPRIVDNRHGQENKIICERFLKSYGWEVDGTATYKITNNLFYIGSGLLFYR
jgi:hypothetical protein